VPTIASTGVSGRASRRVESAEPAAVRAAVISVPSITAAGVPVPGSNTAISAWWVWMPRSAFPGKTETSFAASASEAGTNAGIAASSPSGASRRAAILDGTEARPALTSAIATATASSSASRSSRAATWARDSSSMGEVYGPLERGRRAGAPRPAVPPCCRTPALPGADDPPPEA
jgi:hypothetical protein